MEDNDMKLKKEYAAYLFDMDGTLVNSEMLKGEALSKACSIFGGIANVDSYKAVMGESWEKVTAHFFSVAQIKPDAERFDREFRQIYQELLVRELKLNSNAFYLLTILKKQGKKLGLVSSASGWMVELILELTQLKGIFDIVLTKEQVTKHKPNPEAYLIALEKLGFPASNVLVFEDSFAGVTAAHKADCDVVAFLHEFNVSHDFSLALGIISDYDELVL